MNKFLALMIAFSAVTTFAGKPGGDGKGTDLALSRIFIMAAGNAAVVGNGNLIEGENRQDGGRENPVPKSRGFTKYSNKDQKGRKPEARILGGSSDPRQRRQR